MKYFILCFVLFLSSCTTWTPAVGGRLNYQAKFQDITEDQTTIYEVKLNGPAGAELAGMAQMKYILNEDGTYDITVAQEGTADTSKQADLIDSVNKDQLNAIIAGAKLGLDLAPILESIAAQKIQAKSAVASETISAVKDLLEP